MTTAARSSETWPYRQAPTSSTLATDRTPRCRGSSARLLRRGRSRTPSRTTTGPPRSRSIRPTSSQRVAWPTAGDVDDYLLHVDDQLATVLLDIKLIWQSGPGRQLCLMDSTDTQLICRSGDTGDALANLFLPVGDYRLEIRGDPDPANYYVLRVDRTSAPAPDFETEPNDTAVDRLTLDGRRGHARAPDARRRRLFPADRVGRAAAVGARRPPATTSTG